MRVSVCRLLLSEIVPRMSEFSARCRDLGVEDSHKGADRCWKGSYKFIWNFGVERGHIIALTWYALNFCNEIENATYCWTLLNMETSILNQRKQRVGFEPVEFVDVGLFCKRERDWPRWIPSWNWQRHVDLWRKHIFTHGILSWSNSEMGNAL